MGDSLNQEKPGWLKHLQENSWEAEILISGGAIFSLFQLLDLVSVFVRHLKDVRGVQGTNEIFGFLHLAINGLIIGFICHLLLRSLWIALTCLGYAYPEGIDFRKLKMQPGYLKETRSANLTQQISNLHHLSGLVFFSAVSYVIVIIGASLVTVISVVIRLLLPEIHEAFLILYLIFLLDLVSSGILRRWRFVATIYKPIYLFFNYVSLSFIFRPWLQVLFTNISRWKLYMVGILFIAASFGLTILTLSKPMHWRSVLDSREFLYPTGDSVVWTENFYDNKNTNGVRVAFASIEQDIVDKNFLPVFVPYFAWDDELIKKAGAKDFQSIIVLKIDGKPIDVIDWVNGDHFLTNQDGLITYLDIEGLSRGKHILTVEIKNAPWPFPLQIPFWKQ